MTLHSGLRGLHDALIPMTPPPMMLGMEEKYLEDLGSRS